MNAKPRWLTHPASVVPVALYDQFDLKAVYPGETGTEVIFDTQGKIKTIVRILRHE